MNNDWFRPGFFQAAALVLACALGVAAPAATQENSKSAVEKKWRPKEGAYAQRGANFEMRCGEFGDLIVGLNWKSVSGNEWSCDISRLTDTSTDAIRLDMTCNDLNLAEDLNPKDKDPGNRIFKETMLLRKIDEKSISVRKTLDGKFKGPDWRASYCPDEFQRALAEGRARAKAEAKQKAEEEQLRLAPWHPQNGIYAIPGATFEDRCLKSGDAIIDLDERSVSIGADKCSVTFIRNEPNAMRLFASCVAEPDAQGSNGKTGDGGPVLASPRSETIILKDNKSVVLALKSNNGNFIGPGEKLSYCSPDAQRKYAEQKAKK